MDPKVFERFRKLVYEKSGISLGPHKVSLVSARIGRRMRELNLTEHEEYLDLIVGDDSGNELVHFIDAISTNVTSFFREGRHFEFLREALSKWYASGQRRFRIWCAAASTGEEPYTLAMTALDCLGGGIDLRILATDISTRVLQSCQRGVYSEAKADSIPKGLRSRFFEKQVLQGETYYSASEEMRRVLTFRRLNLSTPPFPMKGPMDVIFCRNVMIYFDEGLRQKLAGEAHRLLRPGGFFVVGHSESLTGGSKDFKVVIPAVYKKL